MDIYKEAGADLLNRAPLIAAYTRLLELPNGPQTISVEAGYGEGKSVFADLWVTALKEGPHTPILFNAWKADAASDPLMAFMASLAAEVPNDDKDGRFQKLTKGAKTLGTGLGKAAGSWALRAGAAEVAEGAANLVAALKDDVPTDFQDELEAVSKTVEAQKDAIGKAFASNLLSQLAALRVRETGRDNALKDIREALGVEQDGKVIVLIDELDRCRPDFAVELLEAVKHLFDHDGFRFVLLVNPERLEATADVKFGEVKSGEAYLTKFIDQRLQLPSDVASRQQLLDYLADPARVGAFTPWVDNLKILNDDRTIDLKEFTEKHRFSLREIGQAFEHTRLSFALYPNAPVDPAFLIALCLSRIRKLPQGLTTETDTVGFGRVKVSFNAAIKAHPALQGLDTVAGEENDYTRRVKDLAAASFGYVERPGVTDALIYIDLFKQMEEEDSWKIGEPKDNILRCFVTHHLSLLDRTAALVVKV